MPASLSTRIRIAERLAPLGIRGFGLVSEIDLFLRARLEAVAFPPLSRPTVTVNFAMGPPEILSSESALRYPYVEDLSREIQQFATPNVENLLVSIGQPRGAGRTYIEDEPGHLGLPLGSPIGRPDEKCVHGLQRRMCSVCSRPLEKRSQTRRGEPRSVDVFELILPVLQPPLGIKFDNVLAFGPGQALYEFQSYGVAWLASKQQALLADEMGLGKSIQAIVALRVLFRQGRVLSVLVVSPKSVLTDWERKLASWAPELRIQVIRGSRELREFQWPSRAHVHLATYDMLRQDSEFVSPRMFDLVLADEIQLIKNPDAERSQAIRRLTPSYRWGLSGTPLENRVDDLAAIFGFLSPGLLKPSALGSIDRIRKSIEPYVLRRRKAEALKDILPDKVVGEAWVELTENQRRSYDELEQRGVVELKAKGEKVTVTHVFALINHLKQICNIDPVTGDSSKLEFLQQRLENISEQGDKALVFSQFPGKALLKAAQFLGSFGPQVFEGSLTEAERDQMLELFRVDPARKILLLSTKAGGLGLTITEANYVFHMDEWWNPATASQAEGRVHRIGQQKKVFVQYIYAVDTIEEKIRRLVEEKRHLFQKVIDELSDVALEQTLTEQELFGLFGLERSRSKHPETPIRPSLQTERPEPVDPRVILTKLERGLRGFIEKQLSKTGPDWWIDRIPPDVRERAKTRRSRNESSWPWLTPSPSRNVDFLDFSDYKKIISVDGNWRDAFAEKLLHREIVVAKLMELEPIRNSIAHNRALSGEEEEVLKINARHLMTLIAGQ